ncbi:nucleotidyltransferase domain-containing protein [Paractinoplanes rishiriensis]|uniref:Uncharacterized protein n=1 Tax=Paractinoplanes rishiriensis TaxID=1050105 RepID=A0A919K212_9ACTN|nr:nucleotidyltransferase domain-containing protein [Actinoplanes rishiriensis]GIE98818.1 hypothetical protein Ari01nite_62830 [Actinoplanes rishiriensis]
MTAPSPRWRELIEERLDEAVAVLGRVPGVHGLIVGGSVGRGEPWPMSDIDLLPVFTDGIVDLERQQAGLVDWWAASGRAQNLDMGRLAFTAAEIRAALASGPGWLVERFDDVRWFHGIDKAYGGRAANAGDALTTSFAGWIGAMRFDPVVVAARLDRWRGQARDAFDRASGAADPAVATWWLRESARALRMVLLESWGERLGSMGREWTRFERMASRHDGVAVAARIAVLAGADAAGAPDRARTAPAWLRERIDLALGARTAVGEDVSAAQNARDQLAAFTVHVVRHHPHLAGPWTGTPNPELAAHLAELGELLEMQPFRPL